MKNRILKLLMTGVVAIGITGCGLMPKEEEMPTAPILAEAETEEYKVATVARSDVRIVEEIRASYIASESEKYSFQKGDEEVFAVYVQLGDTVEKGDVLAELDVTMQRDQVRQQQEQVDDLYMQLEHLYGSEVLDLAQAELQDQQAAENGITDWVSQVDAVTKRYTEQIQLVQNSIQLAEMRLDKAKSEMTNRQVIATIDGTITDLYNFKDGEKAIKGKDIITVSDMSSAIFEIYSENGHLLERGNTYTLICGNKEYEVIVQHPEDVELENIKEDGVYLSLVTTDLELEAGTKGTITLVMEESKSTLCVPVDAVQETQNGYVVYCIDDLGFREMRSVEIGINNGTVVEIIGGVEENEVVIVD